MKGISLHAPLVAGDSKTLRVVLAITTRIQPRQRHAASSLRRCWRPLIDRPAAALSQRRNRCSLSAPPRATSASLDSNESTDDQPDLGENIDEDDGASYVPIDFSPAVGTAAPPIPFAAPTTTEIDQTVGVSKPTPQKPKDENNAGSIWALVILSLAYLHHSTTGFALPALLPIISEDLKLADQQGALLTAGYTVLYALALVPMGLLADRVDRPRLLSVGIALWSALTIGASNARGFGELLAMRVGFAAAQATQNPICFSLIPELFPNKRTTAMALYNSAIYAGRALSFAALIIAGKLGVPEDLLGGAIDVGYTLVPLDKVDLSLVSILYTQGDYAAVSPIFTYATDVAEATALQMESAFAAWRQLLAWLGPPGLAIAALCLLTVDEPRDARGFLGDPVKSSRFLSGLNKSQSSNNNNNNNRRENTRKNTNINSGNGTVAAAAAATGKITISLVPAATRGSGGTTTALVTASASSSTAIIPSPITPTDSIGDSLAKLKELLSSPAFLSLTAAATMNDIGSWALVAWQATFYQRVYELPPDTYAPLLATVIPIGGIIGGVGAGLLGDWLNRIGARGWITVGANLAAAPMIGFSLLAPDYKQSFAALLVGFALSEAWRAPAAVAVRDISPPGLGSTGSAAHLCIRNLIGGLGPVAVAFLAGKFGLQVAMLLVPSCYLLSGCGFLVTEVVVAKEAQRKRGA